MELAFRSLVFSINSSCSHLFAVDEQGEAVEQAVDGVSGLVDGQDDGATVVRHSAETTV